MDAPGVRPVFVGEGLDAKVGGRREAQLTQGVQVDPNAVRKRARGDRLRKERAERGAVARPLFLDDPQRAELPGEVGQPFGEIVGDTDRELPVSGG